MLAPTSLKNPAVRCPSGYSTGEETHKKQEALSQDVLKATIMTLGALKNKQTRSSTCETPTSREWRAAWLKQQTSPDWAHTDRRDMSSWG